MPDYIDTREPGWRRTTRSETEWPRAVARIEYFEDGREIGWVREAPAPPLPTEPYTVICLTWRDPEYLAGSHIYTLSSDRYWCPQNRHADPVRDADLAAKIAGFEVLAEPRAGAVKRAEESARRLTVKAVLDRVHAERMNDVLLDEDIDAIAREFGVSS